MLSDDSLRRLSDRLERLASRDDQVSLLRTWIERAMREHDAELEERELEVLGKLGGG